MRTAASWCALASIANLAVAGLAVAGAAGCTASAEDVRPPQDQLAFPTGLAVTPDGTALFVVNANSELRFDSGSIGVIDLAKVEMVIDNWKKQTPEMTPGFDCHPDPEHAETLVCEEAPFFRINAGVRIGNFATSVALQDFTPYGGGVRVFVPTRGDPSVAWADYDGTQLRCNSTSDSYPLCDDAHRLTSLENDPELAPLPSEPFSVFATVSPGAPAGGFAMVGHIATGSVTLINAPVASDQVRAVDIINNLFAPDISTGVILRGASAIAARKPQATSSSAGQLIYVASSTEDRIQEFTIAERDGAAQYLLPSNFFFLNAVGNGAGNSGDTRGIAFSDEGDRLYLVNRMPPSVQVYDTSDTPTGQPRNTPLGSSDVCREASTIAVANLGTIIGQRVYVTCFQGGEVYVVDPAGQSSVEDIISVGRGPYATAVLPQKQQLMVSNFLEDTIAVIDLDPTSPKRNRVVLRIGTPRIP